MATSVTLNGTTYSIPATGDSGWGDEVSAFLIALSTGVLQKAGGAFTLTADADFGATYGLKSQYFKSRGSNIGSTGILRLANAESVVWRNAGNSADLALTVNSSNVLQFNSQAVALGAAATATASRALVSDASGYVTASAVTSTELGYLSGVTAPTGSGALVLATSPTLVTPILGVASATSINKVAFTAPASAATLTLADGKTLTVSNTLTFTGTDSSSVAFGTGGTVAYQGGTLAQFASTTSAQLKSLISDETGSGALVFAESPTLVTPTLGVASATSINKVAFTAPATGATLALADGKTLTVSNTLTFAGTDGITANFGLSGGIVAYQDISLVQFTATSSEELASVLSDETGSSGGFVRAGSPTISAPTITGGATLRGDLLLQNTSGAQPTLQLSEDPDNGTAKVTIKAPADLSGGDYTLTLPPDNGNSSEVLTTDGNGVLSWSAALTSTLADGKIFVGNGSSVATAVTPTGDVTITNAGVTAIASGSIVNADISGSAAIAASKIVLPAFHVLRGSNQSINNAGDTKIQFNSEVIDTHGYFDSATNFRYTPLAAGIYSVTLQATLDNLAVDKNVQIQIWKNGSLYALQHRYSGTAGVTLTWTMTALVSMNGSTDYLEAYISQGDTGARNLLSANSLSFFSGHLVSNN